MKDLKGQVRERGYHQWAARVTGEFAGRRWSTTCAHRHRKFEVAERCAEKIIRELVEEHGGEAR